jgi:tetratricopeptide (TPR) repeat protein
MLFPLLFCAIVATAADTTDHIAAGQAHHAERRYPQALFEYDKAIASGDTSVAVLFYRSQVLMALDRPKDALASIGSVLERDHRNGSAWVIRGEARRQTGDSSGACEDYVQAELRGNRAAGYLLEQYCGRKSIAAPRVRLPLPTVGDSAWFVADVQKQRNDKVEVTTWLKKGETTTAWTELISVMVAEGMVQPMPPDSLMANMVRQSQRRAVKPVSRKIGIERINDVEVIFFTIEAQAYSTGNPSSESQLWMMFQHANALYVIHYDVHQPTISPAQQERWLSVFRRMTFD